MQDPETKLHNQITLFKESEKISESDKNWLNQFLDFLQTRKSDSPHTKEKYVRWLRTILEHKKDLEASKIREYHDNEKLEEINRELVKDIQKSKFHNKENGEYAKRSKDDQWYTWKRTIEQHGLDTGKSQTYMPRNTSFSEDKSKADKQADTSPEDLPTPDQMQKFLKTIENVSDKKVALRNVSVPLLIYDIGTRYGETLDIQMKQVRVSENRLKIKVEGNKGADDRTVEVFQGRKTLVDYIENHPRKTDPEAYLFPRSYKNQFYTPMSRNHLRKKFRQAKSSADLDFKLYGEPFHIFRKAMNTYYVVNEILSWEQVCNRLGKKPDSTMPTYLKMAMGDIDATAAEGFGLDTEKREMDHRMKTGALLPKNCTGCGSENRCYRDTCQSCGSVLPDSEMPQNLGQNEEKERGKEFAKYIQENPELVADIVKEYKE